MSWNYRVMKKHYKDEIEFAIYEVYYDEEDNIKYWSAEPQFPHGQTIREMKRAFASYQKAFDKPVLDYDEMEKKRRK